MVRRKSLTAATSIAIAAAATLVLLPGHQAPARAGALVPPVIPEPGSTVGPCTGKPTSTPEIVACLEKRRAAGDEQIDRLNEELFAQLPKTAMKRKFVAAHEAWLAYREADCMSVSAIYEGGTIVPVVELECTIARDKQRIADLRSLQHDLRNP
ncbi:MAG TPA: lysozyme inhibitor LprI family protein [Solirubrobacterales bacterium]|jgi:uncharacterized protein YecT (DUF1311 family)|nr:lysozyme inhibitor LprI family protein [Solirubrobacterales bacterium]